MKKKAALILAVSLLIAGGMLIADKMNDHQESNNPSKENQGQYICPMKCEGEKTYSQQGRCPICNMSLVSANDMKRSKADNTEISGTSIFNLTSAWTTQDDKNIELKNLKGNVLVVVMIYTSCRSACPRLTSDIRNIHDLVGDSTVRYVLISIDPDVDTPERLKAYAKENKLDDNQWILLNGSVDDVRELSNVLAVKYKKISPIDFSHSNIISVFNKKGELYYQREGLGMGYDEIVSKIKELLP